MQHLTWETATRETPVEVMVNISMLFLEAHKEECTKEMQHLVVSYAVSGRKTFVTFVVLYEGISREKKN